MAKKIDRMERGLVELYHDDPERADWLVFGRKAGPDRRGFLRGAGLASMGALLGTTMPFSANMPLGLIPNALADTRDEFSFDSKHGDLIIHNDRPVNVETPVHLLDDDVTPSDIHFIRNNGGMPMPISKADWRLTIDGEVNEPLELSYDQLMNDFEHVTLRLQLECGGNGRAGFNPLPRGNPWTIGAIGNAEWTGVRLADVLKAAGVKESAVYTGHYGNDVHLSGDEEKEVISRGVPIEKALEEDAVIAWAMNGEPLPALHGFPLRLVVPGVQGVSWVKWLRRIEVGEMPWATKDEAVHYIDLMPDGLHRQYSSIQECKSVITTPSGGQTLLDKGFYNVSGLAWSGRGKITRVDVSTDGGINWRTARLETPVLSKALTRFNIDWVWDGKPAILQSRAMDDTGYVQPSYGQLRAVRGTKSIYHNNAIQSWKVVESGEVSNVQVL